MEDEVKEILKEKYFVEKEITNESDLKNDLGIDSLDATSLVLDLEQKYNIEVSNEELVDLKTFKDVIDLLNKKAIK